MKDMHDLAVRDLLNLMFSVVSSYVLSNYTVVPLRLLQIRRQLREALRESIVDFLA